MHPASRGPSIFLDKCFERPQCSQDIVDGGLYFFRLTGMTWNILALIYIKLGTLHY